MHDQRNKYFNIILSKYHRGFQKGKAKRNARHDGKLWNVVDSGWASVSLLTDFTCHMTYYF